MYRAGLIVSGLAWPIIACALAARTTRRLGGQTRARTGKSAPRQWGEQCALALRHALAPPSYYLHELDRAELRAGVGDIVDEPEMRALMRRINIEADEGLISDKVRFHDRCLEHGVPTIPIIACFNHGAIERAEPPLPVRLPDEDLFSKPINLNSAQGAWCWEFRSPGVFRRHDGREFTGDEVIRLLLEASRERPHILQPRLRNGEFLSRFAPNGLCSVRIFSSRDDDRGEFVPMIANIKLAARGSFFDNTHQGAIACPVDLATGALGRGIKLDPAFGRADVHPDSNEPIVGARAPDWGAVLALAERAHRAFHEFRILAWDIALSDRGPVVVEAEMLAGIESFQRAHDTPIGRTPLGVQYRRHLDALAGAGR